MKTLLIALAMMVLCLVPSVAMAITVPDSITIEYCKIFRSVLVLNDMAIMVRYNLEYATVPSESSATSFFLALKNPAGTIIATAPIVEDGYGNDIAMLYITPAQYTTLAITWEGAYTVSLMGNPSVFATVPVRNYSMASSDWISSTSLTNGQEHFFASVISQTRVIETLLGTSFISSTVNGYKLNTLGLSYWNSILPGITSIPNISSIVAQYTTFDNATYTYPTKVASEAALSDTLKNNIRAVTDIFGLPWQFFGAILLLLIWMTVAGATYQVSGGNTKLSVIMALPPSFVIAFLFSSVLVWVLFGIFMIVAVVLFTRFM